MKADTFLHPRQFFVLVSILFSGLVHGQSGAPARLEVDNGLRPLGRAPSAGASDLDVGRFGHAPPRQDPSPPLSNDDYHWSDEQLSYLEHTRLWHLQARLSAGWWYDDNITLSQPDAQNPVVEGSYFNVRPSFDISYGPNLSGLAFSLSYDVDYRTYFDAEVDDEVNQAVGISVTWTGARTRAYLRTGYAAIDGGNVDIGDRVQQNAMLLSTGLVYDLTGKTSVGLDFSTELLDYSGEFFGSNSYSVMNFADYQMTPKTSIGLGVGYEFFEVEDGTDFATYDLNLRVRWAASERLSLSVTGGAQYLDSSTGDFSEVSPVFMFDFDYDLLGDGKTSARIGAYRNFHPSARLQNQAYWSDGGFLDISHQIGSRTQLAIALGYEHASYEATAANVLATREDDYYYIRPHLTYALSTRFSISLFYQYTKNDSSGNGESSFERNTIGIMANFAL